MAEASSLHTMPSQIARIVPASHPSMHCGPPMARMMSGMVMNGPNPTMLVMFSAVASSTPRPRTSPYFFLISWCWSLISYVKRPGAPALTAPMKLEVPSCLGGTSDVLHGSRPAFAPRAFSGCCCRHGLATIEAIHFGFAARKNGVHEIPHFGEIGIGEPYQEVIHYIGS